MRKITLEDKVYYIILDLRSILGQMNNFNPYINQLATALERAQMIGK